MARVVWQKFFLILIFLGSIAYCIISYIADLGGTEISIVIIFTSFIVIYLMPKIKIIKRTE